MCNTTISWERYTSLGEKRAKGSGGTDTGARGHVSAPRYPGDTAASHTTAQHQYTQPTARLVIHTAAKTSGKVRRLKSEGQIGGGKLWEFY